MVRVELSCGSYCIDSTEVTQAQYEQFLVDAPSVSDQPKTCAKNTEFARVCTGSGAGESGPELPAVCVDWCDAAAYCRWAGKRLCAPDWLFGFACEVEASPPSADECNLTSGALAPVASYKDCHADRAPFDGVSDLMGNAQEWTDYCTGGQDDACMSVGGAAWSNYALCGEGNGYARMHSDGFLGFRCCAT